MTDVEGWHRPRGFQIAHYFVDRTSLCGAIALRVLDESMLHGTHHSEPAINDCKVCRARAESTKSKL